MEFLTRDEVAQAACNGLDPSAWFPEQGMKTHTARKVCKNCDVRVRCLEVSIVNQEDYGVWGGLSEQDRRELLSRRK